MDRDRFDQGWWPLAQEVLTGMKEWRLQHPTASLAEIEAALDERLGRLRAQMLEDVALASAAATWSQEGDHPRPPCPACGAPLVSRGAPPRAPDPGRPGDHPHPELRHLLRLRGGTFSPSMKNWPCSPAP